MISPGPAFKRFAGVLLLNALLAFPVLYFTYKQFSTEQTPMDVRGYMAAAQEGPEATVAPFRYRILTPLLVRGMNALPGYGIPVDQTSDPAEKKFFFHFLLLNFGFTLLASALLFVYVRGRLSGEGRDAFAWAASLLYLFAFFTVTAQYIPMPDAACHAALIAAILCFDARRPWAFAAVCVAGVLAKEAFLVALVPWVALHAAGEARRLKYLLLALPAAAAYFALTLAFPVAASSGAADLLRVVDPRWYFGEVHGSVTAARDLLRAFDPSWYDRSFAFHALLSNLPLLAAFAAWLWLRAGKGIRLPLDRGLWLFPALLWLGIVMGIGNNAPRLAFLAFPALMLFEARVLQALYGTTKTP
jgi:hypothetical protein